MKTRKAQLSILINQSSLQSLCPIPVAYEPNSLLKVPNFGEDKSQVKVYFKDEVGNERGGIGFRCQA